MTNATLRRAARALLPELLIFAVNLALAWRLFRLEYSGWVNSNEGSFIAISRVMASHPFDWLWWPFWDSGLPFQNAYLPFLEMVTALWSVVVHCSTPLAYHAVTAFFYCLGPVALCTLARVMTARPWIGFFVALAYSLVSPCALLNSTIRLDAGGALSPRRLQVLTYYGEGPQTTALALVPLALLLLYLAIRRGGPGFAIGAGAVMCAVVLSNAFGATILAIGVVCLLFTVELPRFWRSLALTAAIALLAYGFISPWLPPSLLATIRANSPTVEGDFRYTPRAMAGLAGVLISSAALWWFTRRLRHHLRFSLIFAFVLSSITLLGIDWKIYLLPQPHRYQLGMDLAVCLALVLLAGVILDRLPKPARVAVAALALALCALQFRHDLRYARRTILKADITQNIEYKTAMWMNDHLPGQPAFIAGSNSFLYNVFTDNPQLQGGHDPLIPNFTQRVMVFMVYSGLNAGARDAEISVLWLKSFGARAISMSGPTGREIYKPYANPGKFEGVLPVLWREGGDTIYSVPSSSASLAHVVPSTAIVRHPPIHGLDIAELETYVKALEDPSYPPAGFRWLNLHAARIEIAEHPRDPIRPPTAVSVQISYAPGWRASVNGVDRPVTPDGLGLITVQPACDGPCVIDLVYDGGSETAAARLASGASLLIVLAIGSLHVLRQRRRAQHPA